MCSMGKKADLQMNLGYLKMLPDYHFLVCLDLMMKIMLIDDYIGSLY